MGVLHGHLDKVTASSVSGWAYDAGTPASPVELEIVDNDRPICRFVADRFRPDLAKAGLGTGQFGFQVWLPMGWASKGAHAISVRRVSDGAILAGSPQSPPAADDPLFPMLQAVGQLVEAYAGQALHPDNKDYDQLLATLANGADELIRARLDQGEPAVLDVDEFYRRWRSLLTRPVPVKRQPPHRPAALRRRALVIADTMPKPLRATSHAALLDHMQAMTRLDHEVLFVPQDMQPDSASETLLKSLGIVPCLGPYYTCVEDVLRRQAGSFDVVYIHRAANFMRYGTMARSYSPTARIVYDMAAMSHRYFRQRGAVDDMNDIVRRAGAARASDLISARLADSIVVRTPHDAALLAKELPKAEIHTIGWSLQISAPLPFAARHDIAFLPDDDEDATQDALLWLVDAVLPIIRANRPDIRCLIPRHGEATERVAQRGDAGVVPLGSDVGIPEMLRQVRVAIAPQRYSTGPNGRVLQSLAAGIPCVCSTTAAEGFALPAPLDALVAPTAEGLAALALRLHEEEAENLAFSQAALACAETVGSTEEIARRFATMLHQAVPPPRPPQDGA